MTSWRGKFTGGLIGLAALGPWGALLGAFIGHQYDQTTNRGAAPGNIGERFFRTAFRIMGHIAKADGRISEQEIAAARVVMADFRLDAARRQVAMECFSTGKQSDFNLINELAVLRQACAGRPALLRIFLEIQVRAALSGNDLHPAARGVLQRVAQQLDVSALELAHMEAVLRIRRGHFRAGAHASGTAAAAPLKDAFAVLEVEPNASDAQISKAYRRQLSRHHPDKLQANGLPESMLEHAKERTQEIIEAYELIKQHRGKS
jgi:DnaJ like chaperone protein